MGLGYLISIGYRDTLDALIVAFCKDYFSRQEAIGNGKLGKRTRMEYEYINRRLEDAAREIVGDDFEAYIKALGQSIGYAYSDVLDISESEYKKLKKEVKVNIAKKLHLLD